MFFWFSLIECVIRTEKCLARNNSSQEDKQLFFIGISFLELTINLSAVRTADRTFSIGLPFKSCSKRTMNWSYEKDDFSNVCLRVVTCNRFSQRKDELFSSKRINLFYEPSLGQHPLSLKDFLIELAQKEPDKDKLFPVNTETVTLYSDRGEGGREWGEDWQRDTAGDLQGARHGRGGGDHAHLDCGHALRGEDGIHFCKLLQIFWGKDTSRAYWYDLLELWQDGI